MQETPLLTEQTKKRLSKGQQLGGRPTKYKPEFCEKIIEHFSVDPYSEQTAEKETEYYANGTIKKTYEKMRLTPNKMPTIFGFAESIGVTVTTIHEWRDVHEEFSIALSRAKEMQKEWLIANGLAGASPPQSFVFVAKNVTDMRDKVDNDLTVSHQVFFVPREIAEKHGLNLPEAEETKPKVVEVSEIAPPKT